jgi:hypothetical protein
MEVVVSIDLVSRASSSDYVSAAKRLGSEQDDARESTTPKPSGRAVKRAHFDIHMTPALRKLAGGQENGRLSSGSRASKARAMSKLHDAALDIALYDKERKRVGGVTHGRDRSARVSNSVGPEPDSPNRTAKDSPKRRLDDDETSDDSDGDVDTAVRATKRTKTETKAQGKKPSRLRLLVSMYERWPGKPAQEQSDKVRR